jgi:hypothetical protein
VDPTRSAVVAGAAATGLGVSILFALTGLASPLGANVLEIVVVVGLSCFGLLYLLLSRAVFPRLEQISTQSARTAWTAGLPEPRRPARTPHGSRPCTRSSSQKPAYRRHASATRPRADGAAIQG